MIVLPRALFLLAFPVAVFSASGCASWGKKAQAERAEQAAKAQAAATAPRMMGTITLVNEESRFVLIDGGSLPTLAEGTALKSFTGDIESGVLSVGAVRRRPFVIADIVKGAPQKGDRVFQ